MKALYHTISNLILLSTVSLATTIHVPDDLPTIQDGLNFAVEGDTVLVAPGTYFENIIWPVINGIRLIGSGSENCIIDGDSLSSVIRFEDYLNGIIDTTTLIVGFTIQNGYAHGDAPFAWGGGIYCNESSPVISNVVITGNSAERGGGIYCVYSDPLISNVTISGNTASVYGGGGGISCSHSNPVITSVTITGNSALDGGGMYCAHQSPILSNVIINGNSADDGGGLYCFVSSPILSNVIITGNSADEGGGIKCYSNSNPNLSCVTISNNMAYNRGGGIYCYGSDPVYSSENRCNIYSNTTSGDRGFGIDIYYEYGSIADVFVDTFTVITATDYYATPIDQFNFDILHSINDNLIEADVYVAVDGDDSNPGTSPETPFRTIRRALEVISVDSTNIRTIHLAAGSYSSSTNGETFPIRWSNYVNLSGSGESETILDADSTAEVIELYDITRTLIDNITIQNGRWCGINCRRSSPCLRNVTITGNYGSGFSCWVSNPILTNVTITNNSDTGSSWGGGGVCSSYSNLILINVTISGNTTTCSWGGGGVFCVDTDLIVVNSILWNNSPDEIYCDNPVIAFSDIQGGWEGDGNIDTDPLFVDAANGNYHLSESSLCIDIGTALFVWEGDTLVNLSPDEYVGVAPDMGAWEFDPLGVDDPDYVYPNEITLSQNYPNPFNPVTEIRYILPRAQKVTLRVYDLAGRLTLFLVDGFKQAGSHEVVFDGHGLASGVYVYQLETAESSISRKMLLIK